MSHSAPWRGLCRVARSHHRRHGGRSSKTTSPTLSQSISSSCRLRLRILYVFVVLLHHRRRVVHFNVTDSPTAAWTAQQIVEAFPDDSAPRYLLRDRDSIYGCEFRRGAKGMCLAEVLSCPRCPWPHPSA